jgi:hypothetical protein
MVWHEALRQQIAKTEEENYYANQHVGEGSGHIHGHVHLRLLCFSVHLFHALT